MHLIDTNIFLEILFGRKNKDKCKEFLRKILSGEEKGIVTDFSLHSIIVIMENSRKLDEARQFLLSLLEFKGLTIVYTRIEDEIQAMEIAKTKNLDFDDAIQFRIAKKYNVEDIVSYDKHFDKLDIKRKIP